MRIRAASIISSVTGTSTHFWQRIHDHGNFYGAEVWLAVSVQSFFSNGKKQGKVEEKYFAVKGSQDYESKCRLGGSTCMIFTQNPTFMCLPRVDVVWAS